MTAPSKERLRALIAARLAARAPEEKAARSARLRALLAALPEWAAARRVLAFVPLRDEPDLWPLFQGEIGRRLCLPRVDGDRLALHFVPAENRLLAGRWGVLEPDPNFCPAIAPGEIDLVLVPGRAFAPDGRRLGRGGGFYDRLLGASPGVPGRTVLGVCFPEQLVDALPEEPHDRRVDRVLAG